jgi:HEPN domain-containing protein
MGEGQLVREWLTKAAEDFAFARVNLEEGKPFYAQICFHFHQAAEKYLKAYIVAYDLDFRKIHDLPLLLKICAAHDPAADPLRDACEFLSAFSVETRYPVHWPTHFSREETQRAWQSAERVKSWVEAQVGCWPPQ